MLLCFRPRKHQRLGVDETTSDSHHRAGLMTTTRPPPPATGTGTGTASTGTDAGGSMFADDVRRCVKRKTCDVDTDTDSEVLTCDMSDRLHTLLHLLTLNQSVLLSSVSPV